MKPTIQLSLIFILLCSAHLAKAEIEIEVKNADNVFSQYSELILDNFKLQFGSNEDMKYYHIVEHKIFYRFISEDVFYHVHQLTFLLSKLDSIAPKPIPSKTSTRKCCRFDDRIYFCQAVLTNYPQKQITYLSCKKLKSKDLLE